MRFRRTAKDVSKRIVLVDGDELIRLMIQYDVGCRIEETLLIKKVDEEFFEEEDACANVALRPPPTARRSPRGPCLRRPVSFQIAFDFIWSAM